MKKIIHKNTHNNIFIYQAKSGALELKGDTGNNTLWATQAQIAMVFGVERSVVTKHIRNIYKEGELEEKSVCAIFAHTANDGKTYNTQYYNLDMIISIGYRVNSKIATNFRIWSTKTLKEYITKGFVINKKMIVKNYEEFSNAVTLVKKLLPTDYHAMTESQALDLATLFARTWLSLDAYDKSDLLIKKTTKKKVTLTAMDLTHALALLKNKLIKKGEATELFGTDRNTGSLEGIVGNVMQSFGGTDVYDSLESKAAHLLYFVVKNHPFVDGNKRSGAFAFVWFLEKVKILDIGRITPEALTALTLFVAESNPSDKENIIKLIMKLIEK